jgi:hypothetical protein
MIKWSIEIQGDARSFVIDPNQGAIRWRTAEDASKRAKDIRPVGDTIHGILIDEHKDLVQSQGASIGHKWPGYNSDEMKKYVPWKIRKIGQYGPMRWSPIGARLIPSLIGEGADHVWKSASDSFEYGTSLPYAKGHHEGTGKAKEWMGGYTVPMRKLIGVSTAGSNEIRRTMQKYIMDGTTARGAVSRQGGVQ